jgi:hypothetical protein
MGARDRLTLVRRYGLDGQGERSLSQLDPMRTREGNRYLVQLALRRLRKVLSRNAA